MMNSGGMILLSHGGGGRHTRDLIRDVFQSRFSNRFLDELGDSAVLSLSGNRVAFTTDSYVVNPIFFPGGDIGELAVYGTVNDLSVMGAKPLYISAGFIIEEGFDLAVLNKIGESMARSARRAGVNIVTGDTKVVERGDADGLFINTSGIGVFEKDLLCRNPMEPGDCVIINGQIGAHGLAVLSAREDMGITGDILSDTAPLNLLIGPLLERFPGRIKFMRDATRGGLSAVLNEICEEREFGILLDERSIPVSPQVSSFCDILGMDPLYMANEGKAVFIAEGNSAGEIVDFMRENPLGVHAGIIGEVSGLHPGRVVMKTAIGGGRIIDPPVGDHLPRIC